MTDQPRSGNRLLDRLPEQDWQRMRPHFEPVELPLAKVLFEGDEPYRRLYFPTDGIVSVVAVFESGATAEMATVGREGMVGAGAILSSDTALGRHLVQVPGAGLMIGYADFRRLEREFPALRRVLLAYGQAFLIQVLQSVACNGVHSVEERAARWLLMCHDRSHGDTFLLTQEFLAEMLGVSRPAVSTVARTLQRAGLIRYSRGVMTVEDRPGLEEASCECYRIISREYGLRMGALTDDATQARGAS